MVYPRTCVTSTPLALGMRIKLKLYRMRGEDLRLHVERLPSRQWQDPLSEIVETAYRSISLDVNQLISLLGHMFATSHSILLLVIRHEMSPYLQHLLKIGQCRCSIAGAYSKV